jgi:hypothetical protein
MWMVKNDEYDRKCREIEESEGAERQLIKEDMFLHGIVLCRFEYDELPCNMVFSTVDRYVCLGRCLDGKVPTMHACGRAVLKGGMYWGGSIHEKIVYQGVLDVCRGKRSEFCFFDKKVCGSAASSREFPNGCVVSTGVIGRDRSGGIDVPWYCLRIRFKDSSVSIGEKLRSQKVLSEDKGGE